MKDKLEDKLLIFLHIPKTGGLTLRQIIDKQYHQTEILKGKHGVMKDKLTQISEQRLMKLKCIQGHMFFGIHNFCSRFCTYITMLRDPVDRMISGYYHICRNPSNPLYDQMQNTSLKEFVINDEFKINRNRQLKIVRGGGHPSNLQPSDLEKTKEDLDEHFSVVGITEMFDESVFLMKKEFGWNDIFYAKRNVTKNRPSKKAVSKEVIDIIKERNRLDIELYEYAKQNLEKRINSLDAEFRQELDTFIRENKKNNDVEK